MYQKKISFQVNNNLTGVSEMKFRGPLIGQLPPSCLYSHKLQSETDHTITHYYTHNVIIQSCESSG